MRVATTAREVGDPSRVGAYDACPHRQWSPGVVEHHAAAINTP